VLFEDQSGLSHNTAGAVGSHEDALRGEVAGQSLSVLRGSNIDPQGSSNSTNTRDSAGLLGSALDTRLEALADTFDTGNQVVLVNLILNYGELLELDFGASEVEVAVTFALLREVTSHLCSLSESDVVSRGTRLPEALA